MPLRLSGYEVYQWSFFSVVWHHSKCMGMGRWFDLYMLRLMVVWVSPWKYGMHILFGTTPGDLYTGMFFIPTGITTATGT